MTLSASTICFLSDYGLDDEFVGVVHAVLRRDAPGVAVVDLTHRIRPFDVDAGAQALWRAAPHLGPAVVLAVVDPGVGTERRCIAVEIETIDRPPWWVGPDNGLLLPAAEASGTVVGAVELPTGSRRAGDLAGPRSGGGSSARTAYGRPTTFDGRDVMAPAAAALSLGQALAALGTPINPETLVRLPPPLAKVSLAGGRHILRAQVTWIDRFGNAQLAAAADCLPPSVCRLWLEPGATERRAHAVRRTPSFGSLKGDELGIVTDANGRLALVQDRRSAAGTLGLQEGDVLDLTWS